MIHEIPEESIRRLGSTQVITDPISVIKELVENALDAGATSILIEASPDLVSHIQVKDNGSGINPNDRNLMAKPHCTSKISTFDDLLDVVTLGFRGEALASLANISGALTITTRVKDEVMAVACEIATDGSLKTISPVSAPTGSTIKVTNLFAKFPVRKSTLEKTASKYLNQIKPLLLSYYLTHPQTRFQFRCVAAPQGNKGKKKIENKYDIIFAASSTKQQAVIKAFGAESNRHGQWIESIDEGGGVRIEAFVAKADADPNPVSKRGICIAYKNRPLSVSRNRGLAHSIYSLYKKQVKAVFAARSIDTPAEPFLYLNILSSIGKVDINIEPAKDDVLFENNERVLVCIGNRLEKVYGRAADTGGERHEEVEDEEIPMTSRGVERTREDLSSEITNDSVVPSDVPVQQTPRKHLVSLVGSGGQLDTETRSRALSSSPPIKISSNAAKAQNEVPLREGDSQIDSDGREKDLSDSGHRGVQDSGWSFSMYGSGIDDDEEDGFEDIEEAMREKTRQQAAREEDTSGDISISNPWTISKMNSKISVYSRDTPVPQISSSMTRSPTEPVAPGPSQTKRVDSQSRSPKSISTSDKACLSNVPIISVPTPGTPIARMAGSDGPWYPKFGSDNNMSSPNKRHEHLTPRQPSEAQNNISSLAKRTDNRSPNNQKSNRRSAGPIDAWFGITQAKSAAQSPTSSEDEDFDDTPLPISAFFGRPDLGPSNIDGDGGRGIFPSASDRMRQERRRAPNPEINDGEEDISSFSEDDEPVQSRAKPCSPKKSTPVSKLPASTNGQKSTKLPCSPDFFNKPSKPLGQIIGCSTQNNRSGSAPRKIKTLVTTLPQIELPSLRFRARLIKDDLYESEYDARNPSFGDSELRKSFFCFLKKYVAGMSYSDDTELELLQRDILDGKEFDVEFQNLADRYVA